MDILKESDISKETKFFVNRDKKGFVSSLAHEPENNRSVEVTRRQFNSIIILIENDSKIDARHLVEHLSKIN